MLHLLFTIQVALAGGAPEVQVTGELAPKFSVKLSQEEIEDLSKSFRTLETFEPEHLDRNELLADTDPAVFQRYADTLAAHLLALAQSWVDLRAIRYKAAAEIAAREDKRDIRTISREYRRKQQATYEEILVSAITLGDRETAETLVDCKSTECVIGIRDAIHELIDFGQALNFSIGRNEKHRKNWSFRSSLNLSVLNAMIQSLIGKGKTPSPYEKMVAATLLDLYESQGRSLEEIVRSQLGIGDEGRVLRRRLKKIVKSPVYFARVKREIRAFADSKISAVIWSQ